MIQHSYLNKVCTSYFLNSYLMSFLCSMIPSRIPLCILSSCFPGLLLAMTVSQTVLGFYDLDSSEEYYWNILQKVSHWDLSHVFLMIWLGLWIWGRNTIEVKYYSPHISRVHSITVDVNLDLPEVVLIKFLRSNHIFLLCTLCFLEGSRYEKHTLK